MKVIRIMSLLSVIGLLFSCGTNSNASENSKLENGKTSQNNKEIIANFEKVSLKIDGMTCEIGCARTIQSKLSKADGVKSAKISFEEKSGMVEYDSNKISENQIVKIVEQIAGGDLYKVNQLKKAE
ncbi:heavy-metal-associated domain-containing protein [Aureibaculum conchae]|uniref:heavy-metal-associated domain-containing protein n=1 Tax=Aureibaculum sp. 2308TA14-22 TaxID=3108392 RepID=UPI003393F0C3